MKPGPPPPLAISLGERSYTIEFGLDLTESIAGQVDALRRSGRPVAIVTDSRVANRQAAALHGMFGSAPMRTIVPGEKAKSLATLGRLLDFFAEHKIDRTGAVFAVGGGVIGDLTGFAAASYLRGIDYYQVPTTLLAMVDSSVGGKTGVNLSAGKNLVGAFHQPRGVFIATDLLKTLPPREFAAGAAEILKYGLLADAALFAQLEDTPLVPGAAELPAVVRRCCDIKARIVESDEREMAKEDGRALLNLGHTFAHAIEQVAGYGVYLHGEAVAIGLCAAALLSHKLGLLPADDVARIQETIAAHHLPIRLHMPLPLGRLVEATGRDKKVRTGERRFIVLSRIGEARTRGGIPAEMAEACFHAIGAK